MERKHSPQDISWFLDMYSKGQLDLDPPYQRRSVWSRTDKQYFIDTVLSNLPAPPVFLHKSLDEEGRPTFHVVDGKQRLQTIIDFTKGKVRVPDDFADANLQKKRWPQLDSAARHKFWNYSLIVEMLPDVSDSLVKNIFERINRNSRKLMRQELRHAKYDGWFIATAEAETEKQEWKTLGIVTPARMKRMADVQFLSELMCITIIGTIDGFDQDSIDQLYADFEDLSEKPDFIEDDFRTSFEGTKQYIVDLAASNPELIDYFKNQGHFYTLWGYLTTEEARRLAPTDFATRYAAFLSSVHGIIGQLKGVGDDELGIPLSDSPNDRAIFTYALNARGASTDFAPRQARHEALITVMHGAEAAPMKIAKPIRDAFEEGEGLYKKLGQEVRAVLKPQVEELKWFYSDRIKALDSFALKVETGRYPEYARLEDFFGCTIIIPTFSQMDAAITLVNSLYKVVSRRPKDETETYKSASDFTFDDLRLYVKWSTIEGLPPSELDGLVFEIQVKTILQYAWGIATHDLIYKTDEVSWPKERIAYQVKAMLEHAELAIAEAGQLSSAPTVSKQDKRTKDTLKVIEQMRAIWRSADGLPNDLKRLAQNIVVVLEAGNIPVNDLSEVLMQEKRRIGLLPTDLSPYSFVVQALLNHPSLNFEAKFKRKNGRAKLVVHGGMDLPASMLEPHDRIVMLQPALASSASD